MVTTIEAELLEVDTVSRLGEAPFWDDRAAALLWVDILNGTLYSAPGLTGPVEAYRVGDVVGFARPAAGGGYVVAADNSIRHLRDADVHTLVRLDEPETNRINDGNVDPYGQLWLGTLAWDLSPGKARLMVWDGSTPVRTALTGIGISNGIDWSPDGRTAYYIDSATQRIDVLEGYFPAGQVHARRTFVEFDAAEGIPDGLVVDDEGCVWMALWGGSQVRRYSPGGEHLLTVRLPVTNVSSCCFAGARGDVLCITTGTELLTPQQLAEQPLAGRLFACRDLGVTGPAARVFSGP